MKCVEFAFEINWSLELIFEKTLLPVDPFSQISTTDVTLTYVPSTWGKLFNFCVSNWEPAVTESYPDPRNKKECRLPKGQMMSECIFMKSSIFPKYHWKNLIDFCPESLFRLGMLPTHLSRVNCLENNQNKSHVLTVDFYQWPKLITES